MSDIDIDTGGIDAVGVLYGGTGAKNTANARTNLGLVINTDVQGYDADTAKTDVAQTWTANQIWEVDLSSLADGAYIGVVVAGIDAGENLTLGDCVFNSATGWKKTDANDPALVVIAMGLAVETITSGNPVKILEDGYWRKDSLFSTFSAGDFVYVSETAGGIADTPPSDEDDWIDPIGIIYQNNAASKIMRIFPGVFYMVHS